jgi:hypothetical protein
MRKIVGVARPDPDRVVSWVVKAVVEDRKLKEESMVESVRHPAIQTFLEWAREAIGRDPSFRVKVDAALAELTISPTLRHHLTDELDRIGRADARG